MKMRWSDLFGSGSIETDRRPTPTATAEIVEQCVLETRMVTTATDSHVEMVIRGARPYMTVTFWTVGAIDELIGDLIKMRDLMDSSKE